MANYNISNLTDRKSKRLFCRMLNSFRNEYFKGNSPFDIEVAHLDMYEGVVRHILFSNKTPVGIVECCWGSAFGKVTLGIGTVYIKPKYRGLNIAHDLYNYFENIAHDADALFNIQIEKSSFDANRQKFIAMGFTHYEEIKEFSNGADYKEPTYALFRGHNGINQLQPIMQVA